MADNSQNIFRRLTKLFRSGPVVRRKVRDYEGSAKTSTAFEIFRKTQSHVYSTAMSAYGTYDRMSRYSDFSEMEYTPEISSALDIYCLAGDNIIPLLSGENKTIKDLFDEKLTNFYVYSYDIESKKYVPGLCKKVMITGKDQKIFKVLLDDGTYLRLTENHQVLMSNSEYRKVKDLDVYDSLMPLQKRQSSSSQGDRIDDYEMIKVSSEDWEYTHRIVADYICPNEKGVVHHVDFRKWNNNPDNLEKMSWNDHKELHERTNSERWKNNERYREKMSKIFSDHAKKMHAQPGWTKDVFLKRRNEVFSQYTEQERKEKFGRNGSQNGMYGVSRFGKDNPAWQNNFKRHFSKEEIIELILSNSKINDVCKEIPTSCEILRSHLKKYGIKKWTKKYAITAKANDSIISDLRKEVFNLQAAGKNPLRNFKKLAQNLGYERDYLYTIISNAGYKNLSDFVKSHNHRIIKIEEDGIEDVYDLTVEKYHNFAVGCDNNLESFVIVHNSEETCASDEKGRILHIHSENSRIQELLNELFYDTINVEFNLTGWVRNLVKYGDLFLFNDVSPSEGVINAFPMPVNEVEREEGYDPSDPMAVRFRWVTQGNQVLENWQVSHFRVLGNDAFLPYGSSVLEAARRIWRQLILVEDAMLVYRVVRSPERRVFYVDVGNVSPEEIPNYMEQVQATLKKAQVIDKDTGRVDLRYNPLSIDEDYYLPVRGGDSGTRIETLPGGVNATAVEDIEYIQKKLFSALKIPKAYLGYDEGLGAKATLSQEDVRFSRTISRIQRTIIAELNKIAIIHLYCNGFSGEDLLDFTLQLSNPSTVAQQQKLELFRSRFEIATSAIGAEGLVSKDWIRRNLFNMTSGEIEKLHKQRLADQFENLQVEAVKLPGGDEDEIPPDMSDEEIAAEEEAGVTGDEPEEETLELSGDDMNTNNLPLLTGDDTSSRFSIKDVNAPIVAQNKVNSFTKSLDILSEDESDERLDSILSNIKFENSIDDDDETETDDETPAEKTIANRKRRRKNTDMSNHSDMVSHKFGNPKDSLSDPTGGMRYKKYQDASDNRAIGKPLDPLGGINLSEIDEKFMETFVNNKISHQSRITSRLQSTLKSLDKEIVNNRGQETLLSESELIDIGDDENDLGEI